MSDTPENNTQAPDAQPQEGQESNAEAEGKTFDADYVDKLRKEAAKYRTEAKANAEAAKKLAQIEDAQKSEAEKAAERLAAAEKAADEARREALRYKVATKFGVSDEDAELFLTGGDEDTLSRQAERLAARNAEASAPRSPRPDPTQGRSGDGSATTADQFAATLAAHFNN